MSGFVCKVVDARGNRSTFRREAVQKAAVLRDLNQEGYFIISVQPATLADESSAKALKPAAVLEFTQVLATLMGNGLQLKDALSIASRVGSPSVGPIFQRIAERVGKGDSFRDSLAICGSSFSQLYLGLVRIGESTGDLTKVLQRLVEYLSGKQALRAKMVNSLVYPLFVLAVAFAGIVLLSTVILPKLTVMVTSLNPRAAEVYSRNIAAFRISAAIVVSLLGAIGVGIWIFLGLRSRNARWARLLDSAILRVPVAAAFSRCSFGLNFSFAMETLLTSGYSLEDALAESLLVVDNASYRAGLASARESVIKGRQLSAALADEGVFPQMLTGWMAVGEGANDLVHSFSQVRSFFQKEIDTLYSRFMSLAEPALIVSVGGVLIALILVFITPIFTMLGNLL